MTMLIITGGILFGVFTATEAAAVACAWAFFVTMFIYRDYRWRDLHLLVHRTMKTVGMVMILIAFASGFGYMMALMQLPAKVTTFFLTISSNKYVILLLINMLLLFLGTLMDMAPLLLICTPILLPVVQTSGSIPCTSASSCWSISASASSRRRSARCYSSAAPSPSFRSSRSPARSGRSMWRCSSC